MIQHIQCNPEYSFVMAPFYLINNDELLRSQLKNLSRQTERNFEVIMPDPHYSKREWLVDFVKNLKYNVIHFPYFSNIKTPKSFDYGIFNNAVLMSSTNKIVTFQDWRFCHPKLIKILKQVKEFAYEGFEWQVLYKDDHSGKSIHHKQSTIPISINEANTMYKDGIFPDIGWQGFRTHTFHNSCWGHYCINKNLWIEVNGIDEVATNTRHYADLDLNTRLQEYYFRNNKKIEIPMLKNVMTRMMHNRGEHFGGSNVPLDFQINTNHKNCCFINTGSMNDKQFVEYTVENIHSGKYKKLYQTDYDVDYVKNNNNNVMDKNHSTIGFQCTQCGVIGETPHWYEKSPHARVKSFIGIGDGDIKLGRNLKKLLQKIQNCSFDNKVEILNNSWYDECFLTTN